MVDRLIKKVDSGRPEDYRRVEASTETKKDKRHDQQSSEEKAEKFKKASEAGTKWQKYGGQKLTIKPVKVPRSKILQLLNKRAVWTKGIAMLIVTVKWASGETTENAVIKLKGMDEYLQARKLLTGKPVPDDLWPGSEIEIGIPTIVGSSGIHSIGDLEKKHEEQFETKKVASWLFDKDTNKFRWELLVATIAIIAIVILLLTYAMR